MKERRETIDNTFRTTNVDVLAYLRLFIVYMMPTATGSVNRCDRTNIKTSRPFASAA